MIRVISWLLLAWALKLAFDVWWFVLEFIWTIIKFVLSFLFLWAILSMFDGNFIPALFVFWIPLAWIGYLMYRLYKRFKR